MKILTSPSSFGQVGNEPVELLRQNGYEVINNPYGRKLTEDEVIELAADCIGIVAGVEPLTARVMDALPKLKCISRVGIGMDSVDLKYAAEKGIIVSNTPDGPTRAVAELTLAMTLSLLRKIPQAHADLKNKVWKKQVGNLFLNKVVGVVGLGRIGKLVSQLFRGIGNPVIGYDPYADAAWATDNGVELVDFDTLLTKADVVTIHVPGNEDGSAVIGAKEIDLMKTGAFLVNISRGGIVDEEALYNALSANKLTGAAIDVFSSEPYSGPLCDLDNVVLTPHLGSYAEEGKLLMEIDAVKNLINALK
ncbi:phosphoglycerate dehydrogenase [Mucilaginibacter rubeus]|uniref:Phosphoglycerate dehydrogenase n=1 Tax=Mucilaginibacter rubeus TaxID=2027860 RepID=A0AAE6JAN2_9SPHI|nr:MULTISPECIES: phosphoglycerate dehydrogenase [Mucilaginibacter]QEM02050.1 phosphoglycerate dehydrogenase [Mucilaginibacter rubeus]QEM14675.1 phosphoglycerate dehydrogenase [Mucilaginibacter gossypii]QTE42617.1 phosphoglycerate dehydrogenase [Mucilaginibacter rubeus]QTE49218.1 phosphoglycerate dehydrogenase [Mucilaginibacter rubeus]QTE54315.1 phosphoglycerate dehydrogenase [Mucilaginibacter rubeus]